MENQPEVQLFSKERSFASLFCPIRPDRRMTVGMRTQIHHTRFLQNNNRTL